jgi:hypothetical protein
MLRVPRSSPNAEASSAAANTPDEALADLARLLRRRQP